MRRGLAALGLLTAATVALAARPPAAAAQSKRYPAPPRDAEAEAERKSDFWEEVVRPGAGRYAALVSSATAVLAHGGDLGRARDQLRQATALRGDLPAAWGYLGMASEMLHDYKACADAYGKVHAIDDAWRPALPGDPRLPQLGRPPSRPPELSWGVCLAHAGDHATATHVLEAMVARGETGGELFTTLGEVHMATGRVDDAIAALSRAIDERPDDAVARWLRVIAYDRARRTDDVAAALDDANLKDPRGTRATSSSTVLLVPPADGYYILGVANLDRPAQALAYFRIYLEVAPERSPWRARAQEHLDAAAGADLAEGATLEGAGNLASVQVAVRGAMPALRACVADIPSILIELRVTEVGPRSATPARPQPGRPRLRPPEAQAPGSHAGMVIVNEITGHEAQVERAIDCVEKVGLGLSLPRPPTDTYSTVRIPIIAAAP